MICSIQKIQVKLHVYRYVRSKKSKSNYMTNYIDMFDPKNPSQITCIITIIHVVSSCATTNYPASLDSWSKYPGEHHGDHVPWSAGATFRHPRLSLSGGQCAGRGGDWWSKC